MVTESVLLKIETAREAAQIAAAQGKTFTVGKVVAGNGMNNMLILNPATGGGQSIAVQLAGNNQAATVAAMGGKTVTVGNSPLMLGGGASKWVMIKPVASAATGAGAAAGGAGAAVTAKGAAAATAVKAGAAGVAAKTAVAGAGAATAGVTITQIQGANSILIEVANAKQAAMAKAAGGKAFTVIAPPVGANANNMLFLKPAGVAAGEGGNQIMMLKVQEGANQIPALIGKTFSVNKAPIAAGVGPKNLIILKPVTVTGAKAAAATSSAAAAKTAGTKAAAGAVAKTGAAAKAAGGMASKPMMMNAAMTTPAATTAGKACIAGKSAATAGSAAAAAKTTAAAGTLWTGTGWSLGLGLGLGAWGPVILGGLAAAGVYGYVRSKKDSEASKSDSELQPAH